MQNEADRLLQMCLDMHILDTSDDMPEFEDEDQTIWWLRNTLDDYGINPENGRPIKRRGTYA